jgi:hypothetical protein
MYSDKVAFGETHAYAMGIPHSVLLPFYDQVVTELSVPRTPKAFKEIMNMDVETVASLYKRKRLVPVISWPTDYEDMDYLDPLLELKPPTIARSNALCQILLVRQGHPAAEVLEYKREAEKAILGKFDQITRALNEVGIKLDQQYIENHLMNNHVELKCLGFDAIADEILSFKDVRSLFSNSALYSMILAKPIIEGAGGWTQTTEGLLRLVSKTGIRLRQDIVFPVEVGSFLTRTYNLDSIISGDEEMLDKVYAEKAVAKARNLLSELDIALRTANAAKFVKSSNKIKEVFDEARASLDCIGKVQRVSAKLAVAAIGTFIGGISGSLAGPMGTLAGASMGGFLSSLIQEIGGTMAKDAVERAAGLVSHPLLKLKFGPLPISIWRFEEEWKKVISVRPPRLIPT